MAKTIELIVRPDDLANEDRLLDAARRVCRDPTLGGIRIDRRALDARSGARFLLRATVWGEGEEPRQPSAPTPPSLPHAARNGPPVVVVGAGPAGLFAAFRLAEHAIPVVVLDRGKRIQARRRDVAALNKRGVVDPESNYCFGEGGAGTYSDGKLYTRSDKRGPLRQVLETLVAHGAPPDILVDARPHIGSNRLPRVVTRIRETLERAGVSLRFEARVTQLVRNRRRVTAVRLATGEEIAAAAVVLATGHSARDVFRLCHQAGAILEPKAFAVGVRVEHPQRLIDGIRYGRDAGHPLLPAASYRVSASIEGRGVFSFCMCPGGWIVPATTEPDAVVVNGMSLSRRDSPFANSGIVVAVEPSDLVALGYDGPFGGTDFQEELERKAFLFGGGAQVAPAQRLPDLIAARQSASLPRSSYRPGLRPAPLHEVFPHAIGAPLRAALSRFSRTLPGYDTAEAVAVGVETRTSSPIRIVRDPRTLESPTVAGLYPCGEGPGYAGGIASAALDGIRVADTIAATH